MDLFRVPELPEVEDRGDQTNQSAQITCVVDIGDTHETG